MATKRKEEWEKIPRKKGVKYNIKFRPNKYDLTSENYGIGYCKNGYKFYFDKEDYDKIKNMKWSCSGGYIIQSGSYQTRFHNFIMNFKPTPKIMIDHINRIKFDNRKENLRIVTNRQNSMNTSTRDNILHKSGVKGVTWDKTKNKWQATIRIDDKLFKLGHFENNDLESAIKCRLRAELNHFGEYSSQKDLFDKYNIL